MASRERPRTVSGRGPAPFRRADGTPWGSGLIRSLNSLPGRPSASPWPSLIDAIAGGSLVVLIATGAILSVFYTPSSTLVRYHGSYALLRGVEMSQAYASTLAISVDLPGGLLVRQTHHWAALILPAALMLRLLLAFFTGAFRTPRRPQWLLLVAAFLTSLLSGWSGYALPDDLLAGTGLRIFHGVLLGIPVVGTWLSLALFGGEYPGDVLTRLYPIHLAAPVVLVVILVTRFWLARRGLSAQPRVAGRSRRQDGVVDWSTRTVELLGMGLITSGLLIVFGGLVEISPVWRQGPSTPGAAGAGSQPDWYTAFLDGALRLVPPGWELAVFGQTLTLAVLVPLTLIGVFFFLIVVYPWLEAWLTGDRTSHNVLDRARDVPTRTGIGVAGLVFYCSLWLAGSADIIATQFDLSFNRVILMLQVETLIGPLLGFWVTRTSCRTLQQLERDRRLHGVESGVITRLPSGGYVEDHLQPSNQEQPSMPSVPRPVAMSSQAGRRKAMIGSRAWLVQQYLAGAPRTESADQGRQPADARAALPAESAAAPTPTEVAAP